MKGRITARPVYPLLAFLLPALATAGVELDGEPAPPGWKKADFR